MLRRNAGWLLGLGLCLGLPAAASAGPIVNYGQPCDCPPTHYSAFHILTPIVYRWEAWCRGPCRYTFARDLHPCVPIANHPDVYHCPTLNPLQYEIDHYPGLVGPPPSSVYQSPPPSAAKEGGGVQPGGEPRPAPDGAG